LRLLNKILNLFKSDKADKPKRDCQFQPKTKINEIRDILHNEKETVNFPSSFEVIVVGVSFYQNSLEQICGDRCEEGTEMLMQAQIIPYDDNPYDAYAVRVEIRGKIVGHLSKKDARKWRSKMISEGLSNSVTCPAKIVWVKGSEKAGSYGVWLDADLSLSNSKPEKISAQSLLAPVNHSKHIEFLVNELNRFELSNCKEGDIVNLWVADGAKEIFIYRQGTDLGEGKIGICPDAFFEVISAAPGCEASIASIYEGGCKIACRLLSKAEMDEREKERKAAKEIRMQELRKDLTSHFEYSVIDADIYKCYVSNKTGMCDEIGTWEQFKQVEEHIANICLERKGKYYKSQAKTARFAIIFDPAKRTYSNVTSLKEKGYKVTTFEKALEYFGLTNIWNCKKLTKAENDYKDFMYKESFDEPPS
jgi:hypothetical protein